MSGLSVIDPDHEMLEDDEKQFHMATVCTSLQARPKASCAHGPVQLHGRTVRLRPRRCHTPQCLCNFCMPKGEGEKSLRG